MTPCNWYTGTNVLEEPAASVLRVIQEKKALWNNEYFVQGNNLRGDRGPMEIMVLCSGWGCRWNRWESGGW